jgi:hypothetical protein
VLGAQPLRQGLQQLRAACDEHQVQAMRGEFFGKGAADAFRGAVTTAQGP